MKKLGSKGRVCNFGRRVGSGTWNQKEAAKLVYDDEGEADQERKPIGRKRKLRYVNQGSVHHGEWYLEEYTSLVDEGAILLLRKNERYKAPAASMSSGIPSEKKRKHGEIDRLEEKKPRKKKASRQSQTTTSPTMPIQQREPGNGDDNFVFFKGIDIGTWEFPSLDDFVMACPPPLAECDQEALATLEFPSLDEFVMAYPPPLKDCDQEELATLEFPSPEDLASPSPPLDDCDQQVIAAVNIDDNHDLTGSCNDDDIATWSFPIVDYSLTSLLQGKCDEQALALVNSDDYLHFVKEDTGAWCPAFVDDFLMALLVDCDEQA
ncbi:uncharacterized protein LOC121049445 [Rosa chinensis]|nr:uncharacterized protein LOC121049445 [Rosa chinensis]